MGRRTEEQKRKRREYEKKARAENPEKYRARHKSWRDRNTDHIAKHRDNDKYREQKRRAELKRHYDITLEEWNVIFASQNNCCAICKTQEPGGHGKWHTDHIHGTKIVRGILCHSCNIMLHNRVTKELLENMIKYINTNRSYEDKEQLKEQTIEWV